MKRIFIAAAAFLIVSCTPLAVASTPTIQTSPTINSPTAAATVTAIPTLPKERFTLGFVEVTLPTQDLIQARITSVVNRTPVDVSQLTFDVHENLNKSGEQIVFGRDPRTGEIILATRVDPTTGERVWYVAGLRDLADTLGMSIGTQLYSPNNGLFSHSDVQKINTLVIQEYNHAIVIEVGLASVGRCFCCKVATSSFIIQVTRTSKKQMMQVHM